jgi:hypothetical protein
MLKVELTPSAEPGQAITRAVFPISEVTRGTTAKTRKMAERIGGGRGAATTVRQISIACGPYGWLFRHGLPHDLMPLPIDRQHSVQMLELLADAGKRHCRAFFVQ